MNRSKVSNNIKFYHFIKILSTYSYINPHLEVSKENKSNHMILSIKEINEKMMDKISQTLDRRTIYNYINDLKEIGFEVSTFEENEIGYALITKPIEPYELRVLVDSISANRFITKKKTKELIDKLCNLNNGYIAYNLNKQIFIDDRSKSINEEILYSIDNINEAINSKKKISFNYYDYNYKRELIPRLKKDSLDKKMYTATPVGLILKEDCYYAIVNHDKYDDLTNYRIDRMKNVQILEEDIKPLKDIKDCEEGYFNAAMYSKKSFKMFSGDCCEVVLSIRPFLLNVIIDELGEDVSICKIDDNTYQARFNAKLGTGLTKLILQLGSDAEVISPFELRESVIENIKDMLRIYSK